MVRFRSRKSTIPINLVSIYTPENKNISMTCEKKNKILTKDNLEKSGWQGQIKYIFYTASEIIDHLFIHSIVTCIWSWIVSYNNFIFSVQIVEDLW
jgi:hypothetical protein